MISKNDFFETTPIGKLLFRMSLPATVGMLVMALYNVIDSVFIGHFVGVNGLAAVTITFPFSLLVISLSLCFGIGAASLISIEFGKRKINEANRYFGNFLFIVVFFGLLVTILSYVYTNQILIFFGSTTKIFPFAKTYLSIILFGFFFQMFSSSTNSIIRTEGSAKIAMGVMLVGAITNTILDFVFMVMLHLGIAGSAYATVVAQFLSFAFSASYFLSKRSILKFNLRNMIPKIPIIKRISVIGFPTFIRQSSMSLLGVVANNSLKVYGGTIVIAAYGVIFKLMMMLIIPAMGIVQGTQPIVGYNYGAKKYKRIRDVLSLSIKSTTLILLSTYVFIMAFPSFFIHWFTSDAQLTLIASRDLRIMFLFIPTIGFQFLVGGFFQSIKKVKYAFIISLLRQVILLIPLILILPMIFGLDGVWFSYPISDFISFAIVFYIFKKEYNKLKTNVL